MKLVLAGLAAVVLVSGCSDAPSSAGPGTLAPVAPTSAVPSATVTAVPSVTPTAPPLAPVEKPALADEATAAGAEAFARYWYAEVNRAYQTLDGGNLRTLATADCASCRRLADSLDKSRRLGQRYEGGTVQIGSAVSPPLSGRTAHVLVDYSAAALTAFSSDGAVTAKVPAFSKTTVQMTLLQREGAWRVQGIGRLTS